MARTVGLSRKITLRWLNKAVELLGETSDAAEYRAKMNEYLSFEIESPIVLRKTREILMRIWVYEDDAEVFALRKDALRLLRQEPDCDMAVHWCMLLAVYPVFADLCRIMGRIAEFQEVIPLSQLRQRLYDEWGERPTLYHSTDKIIATMKELGAISAVGAGSYAVVKHTVNSPEVTSFMLRTAMRADGGAYYTLTELKFFGVLYPFEYPISAQTLMEDRNFTITNFGGRLSVALKGE